MFPVLRRDGIAIEWNGGAREVERAAICSGDDLDGIWVQDVFGGAKDFQG